MALQYSVSLREAQLNQIESTIGSAPILEIRTGAPPANCAAADSGTLLASMTLPSDWMAAAGTPTAGAVVKSGTWEDTSANATGTAGHFRIKDSGGTTCHMQGTITSTSVGTGDMLLDNTSIAIAQAVTITTFTITAGNS